MSEFIVGWIAGIFFCLLLSLMFGTDCDQGSTLPPVINCETVHLRDFSSWKTEVTNELLFCIIEEMRDERR